MLSEIKKNANRIITAIAFICLMYIDKVVGTESQYIWLITNNFVGVVFAILIIHAFSFKSFLKPFYISWSILGVLGIIGGIAFWYTHQVGHLFAYWATVPLNIWILGLVVFKYVERLFICKDIKIVIAKWEYAFILCMLLMLLSASDSVWPLYYLVIFELFWHAPFSYSHKSEVFIGMLDGLILGFALLTLYAFLYTPYTQVRYRGAYWNCNRNACMYMLAFVAIMTKLYIYKKNKSGRKIWLKPLLVVSVGLTVYTGCRTAILGLIIITIFYGVVIEHRFLKNKWGKVFFKGFGLLMAVILAIPLLYFPMRYIQEAKGRVGARIKTVITGSEVTYRLYGESYVTFEEAVGTALFRITRSDAGNNRVKVRELQREAVQEELDIEEIPGYYTVRYSYANYPERGSHSFAVPKRIYTKIASLNHRINIYLVLLHDLNLTGHKDDELSIDIISNVPGAEKLRLNNAQNYILHYLYSYGVAIGIFFLILMAFQVVVLIKSVKKQKTEGIAFLMFALVYLIMGLMEVAWVPGQLILILGFVAPFFIHGEKYHEELVTEL